MQSNPDKTDTTRCTNSGCGPMLSCSSSARFLFLHITPSRHCPSCPFRQARLPRPQTRNKRAAPDFVLLQCMQPRQKAAYQLLRLHRRTSARRRPAAVSGHCVHSGHAGGDAAVCTDAREAASAAGAFCSVLHVLHCNFALAVFPRARPAVLRCETMTP